MSFSGFSFPGTGQAPQQNTGAQGTSGSTFNSFAAGLGGGGNTTSTDRGLFGGGAGTTAGTSNAPPSIFGGGTAATAGGNAPGGGPFGTNPATATSGSSLFSAMPNPPNITPTAAWNFPKPPEGAAAPTTSNSLGLNTAGAGAPNAAIPSGNPFGNRTSATGGGISFGNLGGTTGALNLGAPTTTPGSLFGSTTAGGTNMNTTSSLFGGRGTTATTTTAPTTATPADAKPTTAAPSTGLTSGFNLGLKFPGMSAAATGTGSTPTMATAPGTTGLNLFAPKTDTATTTTSAAPAITATTAALNMGGLFAGGKPPAAPGAGLGLGTANTAQAASATGTNAAAPAVATTLTTTNAARDAARPVLGLGMGGSLFSGLGAKPPAGAATATTPTAAPAAATPTTAKTATAAPVPAPSVLRGKTIEEVMKKWATELDDQAKEFAAVASEVAQWDRALVENGQYISTLYSRIFEAEATQNAIDQNLDHVEQQQKELIAQLDKYEKETKEIFDGPTGGLRVIDMGPADAERDRNYTLAANLNLQLDELSKSLSQMIESVNALTLPNSPHATSSDASAGGKKADDDPLQQIGAVLNAHLKSLQWIDETVRDVEGKVKEAERRMDGSAMGASVLGRGGFALGETMRAGTPGGELPAAFSGMALRQSEGQRQRGFGLASTMRR